MSSCARWHQSLCASLLRLSALILSLAAFILGHVFFTWSAGSVVWLVAAKAPSLAETVPRNLTSEVARGVLSSCFGALKCLSEKGPGTFSLPFDIALQAYIDLRQTVTL
jgi:hypothetical protein